MPLKIVSDANIPFVEEMFAGLGDLKLIPGHQIDPESVGDADGLLVRTVTRIDAALLGGSSIRFVGSATSGTDHVDLNYLEKSGIRFASAPGGNADSVVEYVLAATLVLARRLSVPILEAGIGIVGCGQVGGRLARRAAALGMTVVQNDPPLERMAESRGRQHPFVSLDELLRCSDIVSFHVPLNRTGRDATAGMIGRDLLDRLGGDAWLFNASRGGVLDEGALLASGTGNRPQAIVFDVWPNEPIPNPDLQRLANIATPHIAGYSRDAKYESTRMIARGFREYFGLGTGVRSVGAPMDVSPLLAPPHLHPAEDPVAYLDDLVRQMYPIVEDHERMAVLPGLPAHERAEAFRRLRSEYPPRYAFHRFVLKDMRMGNEMRGRLTRGLEIRVEN